MGLKASYQSHTSVFFACIIDYASSSYFYSSLRWTISRILYVIEDTALHIPFQRLLSILPQVDHSWSKTELLYFLFFFTLLTHAQFKCLNAHCKCSPVKVLSFKFHNRTRRTGNKLAIWSPLGMTKPPRYLQLALLRILKSDDTQKMCPPCRNEIQKNQVKLQQPACQHYVN